jgi:hypothetical protein
MSNYMLQTPFDASNIQPFGGGALQLPANLQKTLVQIIDGEIRGTKNASGSNNTAGGVSLTLQVLEGEHQGKTGNEWFHLYPDATNDPSSEIAAKARLSAVAYVTGRVRLGQDIRALFNIPFRIDTATKLDNQGKERVNISAYYDANGTPVQQVAASGGTSAQPAPQFQNQPQQRTQNQPVGAPPAGFNTQAASPTYNPANAVPFNTQQSVNAPAGGFSTPPATGPSFNQTPAFGTGGFPDPAHTNAAPFNSAPANFPATNSQPVWGTGR